MRAARMSDKRREYRLQCVLRSRRRQAAVGISSTDIALSRFGDGVPENHRQLLLHRVESEFHSSGGFMAQAASHKSFFTVLLIFGFALAPLCELYAGTVAGVTLPDTATVAGTNLVLNGMGLRSKMMVKVYVAGLYLEQKSSDPAAIMKSDTTKKIVMKFLYSPSKSQMSDAFDEGFKSNSPDAMQTMKPDIDKLLGALEDMKKGGEMAFTYVPGTGTTLTIDGRAKLTIPGLPFEQALMSVWLGPKPPNADLKKGLLGQ